ncbi:structural maintenance of chromosomes protein 5 [Stomoxys calcitrans]|uniref:structural maintenance of chromosomes protein 5 n=1 Tax=Stomoxys calcitrans TaxID=35570 RepID=UPI0027E2E4D2|nr:structural maintenance of chromosomes protein 5 [Stomoxys calcitrans]
MLQAYAQDWKNLKGEEVAVEAQETHLRECELKMEQIKQETKRLNQEHRNLQNKLDECIPESQSLKSRLESLENIKEQKLKFLKIKYPDVYTAIKWLEENANMFEGRVYYPIILELSVLDPNHSKYLENTVAMKDLLAFSCESTSDLSLLVTELCNKKNLLVNIFHAPPPDDSMFVPKIPIEEIRQYGFESYLIDLVQGPRAVLGFLCSLYNLQNIPYGGDHVNSCTDNIPHDIRNYFGGDLRYALTLSKYGNRETSLTQTSINNKGLLSSKDKGEVDAIKNRLNELTRTSDKLRNQRNAIEAQIREKEIRYKEVSNVRKEIQGKEMELKQKAAQIERQKRKIDCLKKEIIVIPDIETEMKKVCAKAILEIIKMQMSKIEALNEIERAMDKKAFARTKLAIYHQENEELVNVISAIREKRDSAKNRVEVIANKCNALKRDAKLKLTESLKLTNQMDPNDKQFPHKKFYISLTDNLEELRDIISDYSGRLDCIDDVDPEIVKEYDTKRNEAEALKKEIESNLNGNENCLLEIQQIFNIWFPSVMEVVTTINSHFGQFMESMGYVGEVKLINNEEHDFESYGIEILVQYRKNVPLQALNRHVQSGGERAVAIAVYTMSMQHITHVPFRCVDEINQGMDARNERKIFEMLVDETTKTGRAQYFFVTPKLLRNLKTNERMSVHVVFNGRMVQSQNAFAFI